METGGQPSFSTAEATPALHGEAGKTRLPGQGLLSRLSQVKAGSQWLKTMRVHFLILFSNF